MIPIKDETYLINMKDGDNSYKGKAIFTGKVSEDHNPRYNFYEFLITEGEDAGEKGSFYELDIVSEAVEEELPEPENTSVAAKPSILINDNAGSFSVTIIRNEDDEHNDETFTFDQEESHEKLVEVFEALGFKCGYWSE